MKYLQFKTLFAFPVDHLDGASLEVKGASQTVFKVSGIGEMSVLRVIAEKDESRRFDGDLVGEKDLEAAMVEIRGRIHLLGVVDDLVEDVGRNPAVIALIGFLNRWQDVLDAFSALGGDEQDRGVVQELELVPDVFLETVLVELLLFA